MKWYMKCFIYWTADLKSSELWSPQLWTQFKQLHIEAWKSQDFNGVEVLTFSTPLKSWLFQASIRNCLNCVHNCDDHTLDIFLSWAFRCIDPYPSFATATFLHQVVYELVFFLGFNHHSVSFQILPNISCSLPWRTQCVTCVIAKPLMQNKAFWVKYLGTKWNDFFNLKCCKYIRKFGLSTELIM